MNVSNRKPIVVVAMPVFNEASGIYETLCEWNTALKAVADPHFCIVDDCSTDSTVEVLSTLASYPEILMSMCRTKRNSGHGPATILALSTALNLKPEYVVAIDGDGQFSGKDLQRSLTTAIMRNSDICEGWRINRQDRTYRKLTTLIAGLLVAAKAGSKIPRDANTPLRVYQSDVLRRLLEVIPDQSLVPNLWVSVLSRRLRLSVASVEVVSLARRGNNQVSGTMFGTQGALPSKKFVRFVFAAAKEVLTIRSINIY